MNFLGTLWKLQKKKLDDLMDHVVRVRVHGSLGRGIRPQVLRFPPETWNIFLSAPNSNHRTNTVEGCHSKFQKLMVIYHPSIWSFFFFFFKC